MNIKRLREEHGYSREKLAEIADINEKYLYEIENGRKNMSAKIMYILSCELGVTMDYLIHGESYDGYDYIRNHLYDLNELQHKCIANIIKEIKAYTQY